ncbi:MAG TPA: histidine kinase dimerization/phospho-acceptor domain-containing protein [Blastocatellia bacterium]|nr:histidine kinase dimerization/phospho-acceptor domain-containing protein [Blastocatellia bacterium]
MPTRVHNSRSDTALISPQKKTAGWQTDVPLGVILDVLPEAISIHKSAGEIIWANRKLCELYSKPVSELKTLTCCQAFHGDNSECPHEKVISAGQAVHLTYDLSLAGRTLSVTLEPLFGEGNQPWGFMRVMGDVTDERNAQEQLLKAERFATLGQLFSGVAHDVGTPLNVISGYAEFLMMRKSSGDQDYKELSAILEQTRRIAAIFSDALELSRPAQGRMDAIDLNALLADALSLVGHHLRKSDVQAGLTCRISKPLIYGEAPQLKQAFFNILLNAGQRVGTGGRIQLVIDEAAEMPGDLEIILLGTEASGVGHDFSTSLRKGVAGPEGAGTGLHLATKILAEAGARICFTHSGDREPALVIKLPANAATNGEQ